MAMLSRIDNRPAVVVFIDLEKAFKLANLHAILTALMEKCIQGRLLAWIQDYLQQWQARTRFQGELSRYRELEISTPQGGVLSPFLFNLLMEQLVNQPFKGHTALFSYADDHVLINAGQCNSHKGTVGT
ncbi:uncharacterized protein LOC143036496 [Oratosquilla oratoria]|uniref:uncharacterized protein LOC143036496 n=1 Tax=Oratosquilla oratoria TaxID=337810 RepID=UPI003F76BC5C